MADFVTPAFLQNTSTDDFYAMMRAILPTDIDLSEGGHGWNMTRPTALIAAELCEFILPEVVKLIFPEWSYGQYLDYHAQARGMKRRAATAATGNVTVTGAAGTTIPVGSVFSTASINEDPSVDYDTTEAATIPAGGSVSIPVECAQTGIIGNSPVDTVIIAASRITGIESVTNPEEITGGTEEETDESLIERINEYDRSQGSSFIGNVADYKRWAQSVDGVGTATVIPAEDSTGLVTIILTDLNGDPATVNLCNEVYNYIMSPDNPESRLAPVNANLSVEPPSTIEIGIKATVELDAGAVLSAVSDNYLAAVTSYLAEAMEDGEVKYTRLGAILSAIDGVNDFASLQIGAKSGGTIIYGTGNIAITSSQLPTIDAEDLALTAGTV